MQTKSNLNKDNFNSFIKSEIVVKVTFSIKRFNRCSCIKMQLKYFPHFLLSTFGIIDSKYRPQVKYNLIFILL